MERIDCPLGGTHTVVEGDTFSSIARAYGLTEQALAARNPFVDPARIRPGQVLCVPEAARLAPRTEPTPARQPPQMATPQPNPAQPDPQSLRLNPPQPGSQPRPTPPQSAPQPPRPTPPQSAPQPPRPSPPQPAPWPPRPTPTPLCPPGYRQGTVQPGERFEDLLLRFDVSFRAMRAANPSLPDQPQPGQRFCAPPAGSRGCRTYTLAAGDTLERAAVRLRTTPGALLRLNPTMAPRDFVQGRIICIG